MRKKLRLVAMALCYSPIMMAQVTNDTQTSKADQNEAAFTFTEAQLGESDDMSGNVTIINSGTNLYASQVGYLFSPVRFRYRAFSQKYNDIYVNGAPLNDMESGQFRFSLVGGLNQQTRNSDFALPFEGTSFAMPGMAGSSNYNFRPASMATGHRVTLSGSNRNYQLRGMYTYNSGLNAKGWAVSGNLTYRWGNEGFVEGTFYNALSYFLGVQKVFGDKNQHSVSVVTWGNPTERASQGASTDEMYWLANNRQYNPYWGFQNGKKRNSRIVNDFSPSALVTWDWNINDDMKLTTTAFGKYSMYSSSKLSYNNSDNPQPDYYKLMPSSFYDVFNPLNSGFRTPQALADWNTAYEWFTASQENRQINWDRLYAANRGTNEQGVDAMYYLQAKHIDNLMFNIASTLSTKLDKKSTWNLGFNLGTNKGMHYQTMEDLLGAKMFHNVNNYAIGRYEVNSDAVQYDLNNPNALVKEGDRFAYDYNIYVNKGNVWTNYYRNLRRLQVMVAGRVGGTSIQREGMMRNGLFANSSFGKSKTATFLEGGAKAGLTWNPAAGHTLSLGVGYQWNAPTASVAFSAPEMNNDFALDLKNEKVFSSELAYMFQSPIVRANINAYYSHLGDVSEWENFYFDDINSFSYVSLTGIEKEYYGVEAALDFKVTSAFNVKLIGTLSDAKYINNAKVRYLNSTQGTYNDDTYMSYGIRENGTPLTVGSVILSYHSGGWFIDLNGNYYDRIFLDSSPYYRYKSVLDKNPQENIKDGKYVLMAQSEGHGGFMLDMSIGKSIRLKKGSLSINLMITNLLNNTNIVTGGYEQSRSDYTSSGNERAYKFSRNPKKYYAYGTNGMLNIAYKF